MNHDIGFGYLLFVDLYTFYHFHICFSYIRNILTYLTLHPSHSHRTVACKLGIQRIL